MKKILLILLGICLIGGILYLGFSKNGALSPEHTLKLGVIAPFSGQYAFLGESEKNAMLLQKTHYKRRASR